MRIYGCHKHDKRKINNKVNSLLKKEKINGLQEIHNYKNFQKKANKIKNKLLNFLIVLPSFVYFMLNINIFHHFYIFLLLALHKFHRLKVCYENFDDDIF